ncbi:MAG: hemin uptake protein HemP [Gammaproteobacteria bacterium]
MTEKKKSSPPAQSDVVRRLASRPVKIPSRVLLGGQREVVITHGKQEYHLKLTEEDELVLTR